MTADNLIVLSYLINDSNRVSNYLFNSTWVVTLNAPLSILETLRLVKVFPYPTSLHILIDIDLPA